jgi:hypothetical protein
MDTRGENGFHHLRRRGTIVGRPVNEPLWRPFRIVLVGGRHVRCDRAVTAFEGERRGLAMRFPVWKSSTTCVLRRTSSDCVTST